MPLKNILQGVAGNLSEQSVGQMQAEYGAYLMSGETISSGFKLIRDVVLFTDRRIILFDRQGTTGQKMRVESIYLSTIVHVTAETVGFGIDDSELTVTYLTTPFLATHSPSFASRKFEFPKKFNIQQLYVWLEEIAFGNHARINE